MTGLRSFRLSWIDVFAFIWGIILLMSPSFLDAQNLGTNSLDGFADTTWGMEFSRVREKLTNLATDEGAEEKVEILNIVRHRFISVRRNNVVYRYSFYKTPYSVARLSNDKLEEDAYEKQEGVLFHVRIQTEFLPSELLQKKIESSHGPSNSSFLDKKGRGASVWNLRQGSIFQWKEPYQGKLFTRRVDYISTELSQKVANEYKDFFNAQEKLILRKVLLK